MTDTSAFKGHFSATAATYSRYRPRYPDELFRHLVSLGPERDLAWDCGCGSGQAALGLAPYFEAVHATDPSAEQLAKATPHPKITYSQAPAEHSGLADASCDLIVAAQAAHWFEFNAFHAEVRRVAKRDGVIALFGYRLMRLGEAIDPLIEHLHGDLVGPYWPPERGHVDAAYRTIPFPFAEIEAPAFAMRTSWTLDHVLGYLGTWSAVSRYRAKTGDDPIAAIAGELRAKWGDPAMVREVAWPIHLRLGRVFPD